MLLRPLAVLMAPPAVLAAAVAVSSSAPPVLFCQYDSCFYDLLFGGGSAYDFCRAYTTEIVTQTTAALPTFISSCDAVPSAMSSACSCVVPILEPPPRPTSTITPATGPPPRSTTLYTYVTIPVTGSAASTTTSSSTTTTSLPLVIIPTPSPTTPASSSSTTTSTTEKSTCTPTVELEGATEERLNLPPHNGLSIRLSCNEWNPSAYAVFRQREWETETFGDFIETTVSGSTIEVPGWYDAGFSKLIVVGLDTAGYPILKQFPLVFGYNLLNVLVVDENGAPVPGAEVIGTNNALAPGAHTSAVTDETGVAVLEYLNDGSASFFARTADNRIGLGVTYAGSGQPDQYKITLSPVSPASPVTSFEINNGLNGWVGGSLDVSSPQSPVLRVSTQDQVSLQKARANPLLAPSTKSVYIKYKYQTDEVLNSYFGSMYNDMYRVTIRSDKQDFASAEGSMNSLGPAAFDANGESDWRTLYMTVDSQAEWVQFDVGVQNAYYWDPSKVIVGEIGDLQCNCGSCDEACPGAPICQDVCQAPTRKSCEFYTRCAEPSLNCGSDGYPLAYGEKYCQAFASASSTFTPAGEDWVWDLMHCLQSALVEPLGSCDSTCSSISAFAFDSYPACYIDAGICSLGPRDWIQIVWTINSGSLADDGAGEQVLAALGECATQHDVAVRDQIEEVIQELNSSSGGTGSAANQAKIAGFRALLASLQEYLPSVSVSGS